MFSKNDCMQILVKLGDEGVDINQHLRLLITSKEVPLEVLKFISKNRGIDISNFYDMLRKKHNEKKSQLYTNIMNEVEDGNEVLITLSSLLTQIFLYGSKLENPTKFYDKARISDITKVLQSFDSNRSYDLAIKLVKLIKSDILVLEYLNDRRDLMGA